MDRAEEGGGLVGACVGGLRRREGGRRREGSGGEEEEGGAGVVAWGLGFSGWASWWDWNRSLFPPGGELNCFCFASGLRKAHGVASSSSARRATVPR